VVSSFEIVVVLRGDEVIVFFVQVCVRCVIRGSSEAECEVYWCLWKCDSSV